MTKIAILGAGKVGTALARVAVEAGYQVDIAGSGAPDRIRLIVDVLAPGARAVSAADAVVDADLVVLALPLHRFRHLDSALLDGHVVLDIMNYWTPIDGEISEFDDAPEGTSVLVQSAVPGARVVKTLNHIGYHELEEQRRPAGAPDRIALGAVGDDRSAVAQVLALLERIGFDAIDGGELANGVAFQPGSPLFGAPHSADRFRQLLAAELDRTRIAARPGRPSERRARYPAIADTAAAVTLTRSAGASSRSRPRRPPLTNTVSQSSAVSSSTVWCGDFCPIGLIPPTT